MRDKTFAFFEDRGFWPAEQKLVDAVRTGRPADVGDGRPEQRSDDVAVRCDLIEYLALGGCEKLRPRASGVMLFGAWVEPADGESALNLWGETLVVDLRLLRCAVNAPMDLRGASVKTLDLSGSKLLKADTNGDALVADNLISSGSILLRAQNGRCFEAEGTIRLLGAKIGGALECDGAKLTAGASGDALVGANLTVGGSVFLRASGDHRFESQGTVFLLGAKIGGALECDGAKLTAGASGFALVGANLTVGGDMSLRSSGELQFEATGEVSLSGAKIGGALECDGAKLTAGASGKALICANLTVGGAMLLRGSGKRHFEASGEVVLIGAKIGSDLDCAGARMVAGASGVALVLNNAQIGGRIMAYDKEEPNTPLFNGAVSLTNAKCAGLEDAPGVWPAPKNGSGRLELDGFRYEAITGPRSPKTARERVAWLHLQPKAHLGDDFRPQPWRQLEKTFEDIGEPLEARRVAVARERARRRAGRVAFKATGWRALPLWPVNLLVNALHRLYGFTTGYGYFNLRAVLFAAALWLGGVAIFQAAWEDGAIFPPKPLVLASDAWRACQSDAPANPAACWSQLEKPGGGYYQFNSWIYSFDVFLPILSLEQEESWAPVPGRGAPIGRSWLGRQLGAFLGPGAQAWLAKRGRSWTGSGQPWTIGDIAWAYRLTHEMMGYLLSAFMIAGAAVLLRNRS